MFAIESGGLRRLERGGIRLQADHEYHLGASDSPDLIVVSRVLADTVCYYSGTFRMEKPIQRPIADDLIRQGTATRLKQLEALADRVSRPQEFRAAYGEIAEAYRKLLNDRPSPLKRDFRDFQRVRTTVRQNPTWVSESRPGRHTIELWYRAERYGGVGSKEVDGGVLYEIRGQRCDAVKLAQDQAFEVVSQTEDE